LLAEGPVQPVAVVVTPPRWTRQCWCSMKN
jgi:hypothetical protein